MSGNEAFALRVTCDTPAATRAFGGALAQVLAPGDVVLLRGELGAGKTTFVKGVVEQLGSSEVVTSPTFVICHLYETTPVIAHVDCWRFDNPLEIIDVALEEVLDDGGVALIEWGDADALQLGEEYAVIEFLPLEINERPVIEDDGPSPRAITFRAQGKSWTMRVDALSAAVDSSSSVVRVEETIQ